MKISKEETTNRLRAMIEKNKALIAEEMEALKSLEVGESIEVTAVMEETQFRKLSALGAFIALDLPEDWEIETIGVIDEPCILRRRI